MKFIILITVVESLLLVLMMAYSHYRRGQSNALIQHPSTDHGQRTSLVKSATHWSSMNKSQLEGQRDDRQQMNGSVAISEGSASVRRSSARRSHQSMYKKWSRDRHD